MGISPIIKNQGESLKKNGVNIEFFTIKGKGVLGYLKEVLRLRKYLKRQKFDVIHAHYSLTAFAASLAGAKPLLVSLMGSDVKSNGYNKYLIRIFNRLFWDKVIVKSEDMRNSIGLEDVEVVPNGIDLIKFRPLDKEIGLKVLGWDSSKKHILFAANPKNDVKNFKLTKDAFEILKDENLELHYLDNVSNDQMPYYYNASDVIMLTSLWEGSPNVVKEAMACNIPIVATNVGDVKWLIKDVEGCYLTSFESDDCALKLRKAIDFSCLFSNTSGRDQLKKFGLDEKLVASKLIKLYIETK